MPAGTMSKLKRDPWAAVRLAGGGVIAVMLVALVGLGAFSLVMHAGPLSKSYDLASLLLGAASLSLFGLSLLIAVAAVFGWRDLHIRISAEIQNQLAVGRQENAGNLKLVTGLFYGRMCRTEQDGEIVVIRHDLLELAIKFTREALDNLENTPSRWKALNNLAFYLALDGSPAYGPYSMQLATELRARFGREHNPELLNTYAKVVAVYSEYFDDPEKVRGEAVRMLEAMLKSSNVKEYDKQNARRHLAALGRASLGGDPLMGPPLGG